MCVDVVFTIILNNVSVAYNDRGVVITERRRSHYVRNITGPYRLIKFDLRFMRKTHVETKQAT